MATWGRRSLGLGSGSSSTRDRVILSATDCYIVHKIYNGENIQDQFEHELEQALEAQHRYTVTEPTRIGAETARWITVGTCLHEPMCWLAALPLHPAGTSLRLFPLHLPACCYVKLGLLHPHGISWQSDPRCKHQVEHDTYKPSRLPLHTLTSSTLMVLVLKDDLHRKRLHSTLALVALAYYVKIYKLRAV